MVETYREKLDPNKPVGTIDVGGYVLLIYPRNEGGFFFRPYRKDRTDISDRTRDLPPNSISVFAGLDPDLLEMIEVGGVLAPQVNWRAGSGLLEEPQVAVTGKDAFGFTTAGATLFDNEITDLFTKPAGGRDFKAASFFYLNTTAGDIMGVAIRRNSPVVLLIAPAIEGSNMSSKEGLNGFLSGILSGLTSRLTVFESEVLSAIAEANAIDYFQMPFDGSTLGGKLQNNLLMQIYTAKTLFLTRKAEASGEGASNRELLEHFPYLKTLEKKKGGFAALLAGAAQLKKLKIEPSLWNELVEDASRGISLNNPHDKTPRPRKVVSLMQRGIKINAPQVMTADEIAALKRHSAAPAEPVISPEVKLREEASFLVQPSLSEMAASLGTLATTRAEKLSKQEFDIATSHLKRVAAELAKMISVKKKGRPPVKSTPVDFSANADVLKMYGVVNGPSVLNFAGSVDGLDYATAIEKSTQQWLADSDFTNTQLRTNAKARLATTLLSSQRLAPLAEHLRIALKLRDIRMINQGIDLVYASYLIVMEKTLYILSETGRQLCQNGQEVEINNWAHYSNAAIERLLTIADQLE